MFYIYKYVLNNDIVYIGQTQDLHRRIQNHSKEIGLGDNNKIEIYYSQVPNKISMDIYEYLLIKKYKPKYNKQYNNDIEVLCSLDKEPTWILYIEPKNLNKEKSIKEKLTKEEIKIRQMAGIAKAKQEGKYKGGHPKPKPDNWKELYQKYLDRKYTKVALAKKLNISRPTLDRWIKELENNKELFNENNQ